MAIPRRSTWLIGAAALIPLLLFLILQAGFSAREERRVLESRALAKSESIINAADGEVKRHGAGLDAIATARSLRDGDLEEFRARAAELMQIYPGWTGINLIDEANDRQLLSIGGAGRTLDRTSPGQATSRPRLAGFARGEGCPCVIFDRRANGPAGRDWAIQLLVSTEAFDRMLPPGKGQYEVSAIVGPNGRFISRSIANDERLGTPGSKYLLGAVNSHRQSGIYSGFTLEGYSNYTAFTRSPLTGWSAHVALGSNFIDNPSRRFFASLGSAAALSMLLAAVLVWFALRQMAEGRRLAERMQQAQKVEALGQLTGGIAHDFNNLLTPIVGALHLLSGKPELDARSKRLASGALSSAERAAKLTAQLLAFSRRQKLQIEPVNIGAILDEMSDLFHQSVGDTHQLEIICDEELCAMTDLNQLELAILNLVLNARDASPAGSTIGLSIRSDGAPGVGHVVITVTDEGTGMDERTRAKAFEPFFTTKREGSGTGLGLAQVYGMAQQSGGSVTIDSVPGDGTSVTLRLRRADFVEPTRHRQLARALGESVARLRLLVVDDEPDVRLAIVRPLEDAGHIVDAVSDAATALEAVKQRAFDLVLVDFAMPGMNGAELIARARDIRPDARFAIISGYADSDAIAEAAPDVKILKKPFTPDDLLALVAGPG